MIADTAMKTAAAMAIEAWTKIDIGGAHSSLYRRLAYRVRPRPA